MQQVKLHLVFFEQVEDVILVAGDRQLVSLRGEPQRPGGVIHVGCLPVGIDVDLQLRVTTEYSSKANIR